MALARLGHETAMVSRVPDNALGEAAVGHLRRYGVDASGLTAGPGRMGLYFLSPGAGVRPGIPVSARAWLRCGIESSNARV